jgi:hypothetical protein
MRREALIGNIAERMGDTARAFAAFERMNAAALADAPPQRGATFRQTIAATMDGWSEEWAASWSPAFVPDPARRDPVFLVGFPRSGTTLLDTMLMGLPELCVLEERPMVAELLAALGSEDLAALGDIRLAELRDAYFASAARYGWQEGRWLVDKHPLNMARAVQIHRLFPEARFIMAERHPADAVLSCFMANFQLNHAMRSFTDLAEAAHTYDTAFTAWHRAKALFPIASHEVRYERLVEDPRGPSWNRWLAGSGWNGTTACSRTRKLPATARACAPPAMPRSGKSSIPAPLVAGVVMPIILCRCCRCWHHGSNGWGMTADSRGCLPWHRPGGNQDDRDRA